MRPHRANVALAALSAGFFLLSSCCREGDATHAVDEPRAPDVEVVGDGRPNEATGAASQRASCLVAPASIRIERFLTFVELTNPCDHVVTFTVDLRPLDPPQSTPTPETVQAASGQGQVENPWNPVVSPGLTILRPLHIKDKETRLETRHALEAGGTTEIQLHWSGGCAGYDSDLVLITQGSRVEVSTTRLDVERCSEESLATVSTPSTGSEPTDAGGRAMVPAWTAPQFRGTPGETFLTSGVSIRVDFNHSKHTESKKEPLACEKCHHETLFEGRELNTRTCWICHEPHQNGNRPVAGSRHVFVGRPSRIGHEGVDQNGNRAVEQQADLDCFACHFELNETLPKDDKIEKRSCQSTEDCHEKPRWDEFNRSWRAIGGDLAGKLHGFEDATIDNHFNDHFADPNRGFGREACSPCHHRYWEGDDGRQSLACDECHDDGGRAMIFAMAMTPACFECHEAEGVHIGQPGSQTSRAPLRSSKRPPDWFEVEHEALCRKAYGGCRRSRCHLESEKILDPALYEKILVAREGR